MADRHSFFVTCALGMEPVLVAELQALGAVGIQEQASGVIFEGDASLGWRACLHLRTGSRVLQQLHRFDARTPEELYEGVRAVDWSTLLDADMTLSVRATTRKSRLDHTHFISLKTKDAIVDRLRDDLGRRPSVNLDAPDVPISVHIASNKGAVFADLSGTPLFKRAYRQDAGEAPLKETLAASLILTAGYGGEETFVDPMCGAGTLAIEAALIAARKAPGLGRSFAFERWRSFDEEARSVWTAMRAEATEAIRPAPPTPTVFGFDKDAHSVDRARVNAERAGVAGWVQFERGDALNLVLPSPAGLLMANPPYGHRLGEEAEVAAMMERWGWHLKESAKGWRLAILSGQENFRRYIPLKTSRTTHVYNGPIKCSLFEYKIFKARIES